MDTRHTTRLKDLTTPIPFSGPALRQARLRAGLTQEQLAHVVESTTSSVNRWELEHSVPHRLMRRALAGFIAQHA